MNLKEHIRYVSDFPKRGVGFLDISPLLQNAEAFADCLDALADRLPLNEVSIIAGIELRGAVFAAALAAKFRKGFLPVRKAGKLPPPTLRASYTLEYGQAEIEVQPGTASLVLIDDVLATGGTLAAATELLTRAGYDLRGMAVLATITALKGFQWQGHPVPSLIEY